jgi:hypothetical protein
VDIETGHGLVTDVCLKRKIRNYVALTKECKPPYDIYMKERGILANEQKKAYLDLGVKEGSDGQGSDGPAEHSGAGVDVQKLLRRASLWRSDDYGKSATGARGRR